MRKIIFALCLILGHGAIDVPVNAADHSTLRFGDSGYEVTQVQYLLASFGYILPVDGEYGTKTVKAVIHFQKANGLFSDGVTGTQTWKVLDKYIQPAPSPQVTGDGPEAARAALSAAGVDSGTIEWAVSICQRESHCRLGAHNYNPRTRDDSWGPWQLNYYGSMSARMGTIGPKESNVSSWASAVANFLKLFNATGRCPWQKPNYCA